MQASILLCLFLSACTLVVGSDPRVETDAAVADDAADDASSPVPDAATPLDTGQTCDAGGCNAMKDACKKTCSDGVKTCNDGCDGKDGKNCHDLCNQQLQSCNSGCLATCLQCVLGCGTCGP